MTNDRNTLNGALQALGEKLARNLTIIGIPSTPDEGLTTLVDKILTDYPILTLTVTGSSFSSYSLTPFDYTGNLFVDWGDGTSEAYNGRQLSHTFVDSANTHEITVYGNITSLRDSCFMNCSSLTSIEIGNSVTSLGYYCFYRCASLTSIELPNSLTSLGYGCFMNCSSLTSIELPNSVTNLGDRCFNNCTSLSSLVLNWETSNTIIAYNTSTWAYSLPSTCRFSIPLHTKDLYIAKNYPSDRLEERNILFKPLFDGTTPVIKQYDNSNANTQSDGVATFKGCVIAEGWDNTGLWELTVDIRYQGDTSPLRYTGLILLTNVDTPFAGWGIRNWEGPVTGTPNSGTGSPANYTKTPNTTLADGTWSTSYSTGYSPWYTLHMKKSSMTTLEVYKEFENGTVSDTVVYEWAELSNVDRVTMGGATNGASPSAQGSVAMKNLIVREI